MCGCGVCVLATMYVGVCAHVGCVSRLSFSEGRREPGNIGGVKSWTSAARILAEPIRLHNKST